MSRPTSTPPSTSRAVQLLSFDGPQALQIREVPVPQPGPGHVRVRVMAAGLNPMDWFMTSDPATAARFRLSLPCGFGTDYAGAVDAVGAGVSGFEVGDRVFGGALSRAVADHVVVEAGGTIAAAGDVHHTPNGVDDRTAATLTIGGCTAADAVRRLAQLPRRAKPSVSRPPTPSSTVSHTRMSSLTSPLATAER